MFEAIFSGIALAMDAFAVSICAGAADASEASENNQANLKRIAFRLGAAFGLFQFLMPLVGWAMGDYAQKYFDNIAAYIAFAILLITGLNMIYGYFKSLRQSSSASQQQELPHNFLSFKVLIAAAIATSIDALMIGAGFALADMSVLRLAVSAGIITFTLCLAGVYLGNALGSKFGSKAELLGGIVLIIIGVNILFK